MYDGPGVVVADMQGQGRTPDVPRALSYEQFAERVAEEQRVSLSERDLVPVLQPGQPLVGGEGAQKQRDQRRDPGPEQLELTLIEHDRLNVAPAREQHVGLGDAPQRKAEVEGQCEEGGQEHHRAHTRFRGERPDEDARVFDLAEPEEFGQQPHGRRDHQEKQQNGEQEDKSRWHAWASHSDTGPHRRG